MAAQSWTLVDAAQGTREDFWKLDGRDVKAAPDGLMLQLRTLRGGISDGVQELQVHNGRFGFVVLPTRGMGIWKAWWDTQLTLGWQSPVNGPVHPRYVPLSEPSGLGWLDGFDELMCRCGPVSNGAPDFDEQGRLLHPLHGRLANRPASHLEVSIEDDQITVTGVVDDCRFHFQKLRLRTRIRTRFNQPTIYIEDEIENLSASETTMQMLYHTNLGTPLLSAGAELVLPAEVVVPRNDWSAKTVGHWSTYSEPLAGTAERVYFFKLHARDNHKTTAVLKNKASSWGVQLDWDVRQLPCFTQWKNETALEDGYVTGLEPGTNFPNPRSFEETQGRVVKLAAGGTHRMRMDLTVLPETTAVEAGEAAVHEIQDGRETLVHQHPLDDWCA